MEEKNSLENAAEKSPRRTEPLIFISHDTRDAEIAEAFPWLYEVATDLYRKIETSHPDTQKSARRFLKLAQRTFHSPVMWELFDHLKDRRFELEELTMFMDHVLHRVLERAPRSRPSGSPGEGIVELDDL